MQTSDRKKSPMSGPHRELLQEKEAGGKSHTFLRIRTVFKCVTLLAVLILLNSILSWLLEPYLGSSEEMWRNYRTGR